MINKYNSLEKQVQVYYKKSKKWTMILIKLKLGIEISIFKYKNNLILTFDFIYLFKI